MSDLHKDVDVEDHIRTMMANTSRSKNNEKRICDVERKQDEVREVLIPAVKEEVKIVRQELQHLANLPEQVRKNGDELRENGAYNRATRWLIASLVVITGLIVTLVNLFGSGG